VRLIQLDDRPGRRIKGTRVNGESKSVRGNGETKNVRQIKSGTIEGKSGSKEKKISLEGENE
jgi:hypothetical protein